MTSATAFAPLLAPVLDDSMEVSSPAGSYYDDEVLIDYDDYGTAAFTEDEPMIEDGDLMRHGTATDDMMEDDEPRSPTNEEIMQDDPVAVAPEASYIEDEELIDYSDEDYQEDTQLTFDDPTVHIAEATEDVPPPHAENVIEPEVVDVAAVQQDEASTGEPTANFLSAGVEDGVVGASPEDEAAVVVAGLDPDTTTKVERDDAAEELSRQIDGEEAAAQELGLQVFEADEPDAQAIDAAEGQQVHEETEVSKHPPRFPAGLDTTAYFAPDGPQTPSDTGIHPIMVRYGDILMPLFKSRAQPDGLLKDDNLASVSLGDFLDNCRHRLPLKIGESISADQELVLNFENMGLQLVEHSPHAFVTSLYDVLEVYLRLHRNDSTQAIPPLALSLSVQLKFTSSFNILKAAAQQGEGMSKFAYLRSGAEELDEYEEEEGSGEEEEEEEDVRHEEDQEIEATGEEQHYEDGEENFAENNTEGQVSHLEGQEYEEDQYPENEEESQEREPDQSHEAHADTTKYEVYEEQEQEQEQEQTDASPELEQQSDDDHHHDEVADSHNDALDEEALEHEAEHFDPSTAQESEEHARPQSAASSTTVRGDLTNDTTGEYYNEDFIDFGDDDLTAETAELHEDDENDNSATLVDEDDVEELIAEADGANAVDDGPQHDTTYEASAPDSDSRDPADQHSNLELDGELAEEDGDPRELPEEADNVVSRHGQDEDASADNLDLNEEDLPAEDDEQFDTAFDLLEGHDFEDVAANGESTQTADDLEYDDDDIGFNDDVEEAVLASGSPLGKRSFDEHVGKNGVAEEQESKKVRS